MNRYYSKLIHKVFLVFYLLVFSWPLQSNRAASYENANHEHIGGLDLFVLIDCSGSVAKDLSINQLGSYKEDILEAIFENVAEMNLRAGRVGDRISIDVFAGDLYSLVRWEVAGNKLATRDRLYKIAQVYSDSYSPPELKLKHKTDFAHVLRQKYAHIKGGYDNTERQLPQRPRLLIIVSDGINDPLNQLDSRNGLVGKDAVRNLFSDLKNNLFVQPMLVQLPISRGAGDTLTYEHSSEWSELLGEWHLKPNTTLEMPVAISSSLKKMRDLTSQNISVCTHPFYVDKSRTVRGTFHFDLSDLPEQEVLVRIALTKIESRGPDKQNKSFYETDFARNDRRGLQTLAVLRAGLRDGAECTFTLPEEVPLVDKEVNVTCTFEQLFRPGAANGPHLDFSRKSKCVLARVATEK